MRFEGTSSLLSDYTMVLQFRVVKHCFAATGLCHCYSQPLPPTVETALNMNKKDQECGKKYCLQFAEVLIRVEVYDGDCSCYSSEASSVSFCKKKVAVIN